MSIKRPFVLLICALFALSLYTGCSSKKETKTTSKRKIYEKIVKEREERAAKAGQDKSEDAAREKQLADAEACLERYNSCLEKCKNSSCENGCLNALSVCEKDLPPDLKTIKEE